MCFFTLHFVHKIDKLFIFILFFVSTFLSPNQSALLLFSPFDFFIIFLRCCSSASVVCMTARAWKKVAELRFCCLFVPKSLSYFFLVMRQDVLSAAGIGYIRRCNITSQKQLTLTLKSRQLIVQFGKITLYDINYRHPPTSAPPQAPNLFNVIRTIFFSPSVRCVLFVVCSGGLSEWRERALLLTPSAPIHIVHQAHCDSLFCSPCYLLETIHLSFIMDKNNNFMLDPSLLDW